MAQLNRYSFAGYYFNQPNVKVRQVTKGSPPLRGSNFIAPGRTGEIWAPKKHGGRMLTLEILVIDEPRGTARMIFDQIQQLAATRTQSALVNYLDSGPRAAQAEIVNWMPQDIDNVGLVFVGQLDFYLADPWFYGATVSGSVTPVAGIASAGGGNSQMAGPRTSYTVTIPSGVTSGQPLVLTHFSQSTGAITSITDTFSGAYTWTRVDGNNVGSDVEIYIGTGGTGTSGTITVNHASAVTGGSIFKFVGASTAAGLSAVETHGNKTGTGPTNPNLTLTPGNAYEATIFALGWVVPGGSILSSATPNFSSSLVAGGALCATMYGFLNLPAAAFGPPYDASGNATAWIQAAMILKGSGTAATISLTHPGTVTAEALAFDFLGPIGSPTVMNLTNGTRFTVNASVAGTKHLLVDTGSSTAVNDGLNVVGQVTHSGAERFLTLSPGANTLQISGGLCTGSSLVSVSFAAPYE